jgi:hypothetical protein
MAKNHEVDGDIVWYQIVNGLHASLARIFPISRVINHIVVIGHSNDTTKTRADICNPHINVILLGLERIRVNGLNPGDHENQSQFFHKLSPIVRFESENPQKSWLYTNTPYRR